MTNTTYEALENDAIAEAEMLLMLGVHTDDIVMVMTGDVYLEAVGQESFWCTDILPDTMTARARFYGYDVGIINEDAETMFKAAVKGMNYYEGMTVGNTIIVDEDASVCRIYTLENTMPVCFADTGLTVRFKIAPTVTNADRPADYGRITLADTLFWKDMAYLPSDRMASVAAAPLGGVDLDSVLRTIQNVPWEKSNLRPKPKIRHPKEVKLNARDTKELDDFLNSFSKKSALESAT